MHRTIAGSSSRRQRIYTAWISGADRAGLHVAVHAIGDRANATNPRHLRACRARERARATAASASNTRNTSAPADIPRFQKLNVIASMQPYHAIDDGRWAARVIGPVRVRTTYAFRSLLDAGARLAFGSDWYVAPPVPLDGIYAAVTRRTLDGNNPDGWVPEQKITVDAALRAYTTGGAYASFRERDAGTIAPGMLADLDRHRPRSARDRAGAGPRCARRPDHRRRPAGVSAAVIRKRDNRHFCKKRGQPAMTGDRASRLYGLLAVDRLLKRMLRGRPPRPDIPPCFAHQRPCAAEQQ